MKAISQRSAASTCRTAKSCQIHWRRPSEVLQVTPSLTLFVRRRRPALATLTTSTGRAAFGRWARRLSAGWCSSCRSGTTSSRACGGSTPALARGAWAIQALPAAPARPPRAHRRACGPGMAALPCGTPTSCTARSAPPTSPAPQPSRRQRPRTQRAPMPCASPSTPWPSRRTRSKHRPRRQMWRSRLQRGSPPQQAAPRSSSCAAEAGSGPARGAATRAARARLASGL
mmetsp:Transcript_79131/g.256219  ORF Transcript_79131/g.256219 Transcript_79131/m.256219 type:complete len:229 (-) Transcript_79131:837-1523(-)